MTMQLSIKVVYDSKFSGIIFDEPKMLTLSAFRTRIAARIGITNAEKLDRMCLVYRDYDGENTITTDEDLKWLVRQARNGTDIRLHVSFPVDVCAMASAATEALAGSFDIGVLLFAALIWFILFVSSPVLVCILTFCMRRYNPLGCNDVAVAAWQRATSASPAPAAPQAPASPVLAASAGREYVEVAAAAFDAGKAHVEGCIDRAALAEVAGKAMAKEILRQRDAAAQKAAPVSPPAPAAAPAPAPFVEDLRVYLELLNRMKLMGYTNEAQNARHLAANGNDVLRALAAIDREADAAKGTLCGNQ